MANENIKIMNWKNGLLLSTVSYMLYLILWFILDDETAGQLPEMAIADYIIDYLLCMLFTYISLGFSFLVFRARSIFSLTSRHATRNRHLKWH